MEGLFLKSCCHKNMDMCGINVVIIYPFYQNSTLPIIIIIIINFRII